MNDCYWYWKSVGGCFLYKSWIYYEGTSRNYCDSIRKKGSIVIMLLNMDNHSISYKINDKDYGVAYDKLISDNGIEECWTNC